MQGGPGALRTHRDGVIAVLVAAVLWSTGGLFIKWVDMDALGITMWRSGFALLTLAAVTRPGWHNPLRADRLTWGIALSYAAMMVMFVAATRMTTAANAIFLQYTAPLYLLVIGHVFLRERATGLDVLTVALAFGGMALFFVGKLEADAAAGNGLALASGLMLAVMFALLRSPRCGPKTRPRAMVLGNLVLIVGLLAVNAGRGSGAAFTPGMGDLAGLVFLGVVQIGVSYAVFSYGIMRVGALEASLIGMLEPVLNPVWVFLLLGETPGWWAVAGGAVIIAAVAGRTVVTELRRARVPTMVGAGP
jgi:drug/metabolite transporter, DME family